VTSKVISIINLLIRVCNLYPDSAVYPVFATELVFDCRRLKKIQNLNQTPSKVDGVWFMSGPSHPGASNSSDKMNESNSFYTGLSNQDSGMVQ